MAGHVRCAEVHLIGAVLRATEMVDTFFLRAGLHRRRSEEAETAFAGAISVEAALFSALRTSFGIFGGAAEMADEMPRVLRLTGPALSS